MNRVMWRLSYFLRGRIFLRCSFALLFLFVSSFLSWNCGNDCETGSTDPRCEILCTINPPYTEGVGEVCSQSSADDCKSLCGVRIEGAETLCIECLLEDAVFSVGQTIYCDYQVDCTGGTECHYKDYGSDEILCTYTKDNDEERDACLRQLCPLREVDCDTRFREVIECESFCT